jgi:hypothetical protein
MTTLADFFTVLVRTRLADVLASGIGWCRSSGRRVIGARSTKIGALWAEERELRAPISLLAAGGGVWIDCLPHFDRCELLGLVGDGGGILKK